MGKQCSNACLNGHTLQIHIQESRETLRFSRRFIDELFVSLLSFSLTSFNSVKCRLDEPDGLVQYSGLETRLELLIAIVIRF